MKTETDTVPPDSAAERSISEIISNLRLTFRSSDFNRAEAELVAREVSLRREISLLRKEKQSALEMRELDRIAMVELREELAAAPASGCCGGGGADLEAERGRAIAAEEENKSLTAEVSELRTRARKAEEKAEEFKLRVAALEIDMFELLKSENALRNSGVKSSSKEHIEILDSDDDCATVGKSSREESLSPKVSKRKRSLSPNISGTKNDRLAGGPTVANGNINQEPKAPLLKPFTSPAKHDSPVKKQALCSSNGSEQPNAFPKPFTSPAKHDSPVQKQALCSSNGSEQPNAFPKPFTSPPKHDSPVKKQALSSSNISEQPNAVPSQTPRVSDQADKGSGAKKFSTANDYKNFWSHFSEIRRATEDSNKERSS